MNEKRLSRIEKLKIATTQGCDMTRENKLAMVVGFGLLLFVGILVSDHFSTAQRQETANLTSVDATRGVGSRPISIKAMPIAGVNAVQPTEVMAAGAPTDLRAVSNKNNLDPMAPAANPSVRPISNVPYVPATTAPATIEVAKNVKLQESEPGVKLHPIAAGETLYSICAQTYGDGTLWQELAEYNKKALPNPAKLRKGVTLRLPPVEQLRRGAVVASTIKGARVGTTVQEPANGALQLNIQDSKTNQQLPLLAAADIASVEFTPHATGTSTGVIEVAVSKVGTSAKGASTRTSSKEIAVGSGESIYVVQKGDTLGSIAKKKLGTASKWRDIASANSSTLSDPAALSPGMTIKLPKTN